MSTERNESVRIGVLGTGHMAQTMMAAARHVDGVIVTAVASRDRARACSVAAGHRGVSGYHGLDAMLAEEAIDAVYIANDTAGHAEAAIAALGAGKAVLCEKPAASSSMQAEAIVAASIRHDRLFMEALATPFLPAVRKALSFAVNGEIGEMTQLSASFGYPTKPESHPGCWRAEGGGVLLDRAVYLVALARMVSGPIVDFISMVTLDRHGIDVDAALLVNHKGGALSQLSASLTSLLPNNMVLAGTRGVVTVEPPLLAAEWTRADHATEPERPSLATGVSAWLRERSLVRRARRIVQPDRSNYHSYGLSPYMHELAHFRDLYRSGLKESPIVPRSLTLDVMRVLTSAREKAR